MITSIDDCFLVPIYTISRDEGELGIVEELTDVPFRIRRIYFLYDVPYGNKRGSHAHKELTQLLIAVNGSMDVVLEDGWSVKTVTLNTPKEGLVIPSGIWRSLENFTIGSVCLVVASELYDEKDYIRDYDDFLKYKEI
jgi:dTDP-4-dehydrorhamnose 3,5-epimerase-like enzyme